MRSEDRALLTTFTHYPEAFVTFLAFAYAFLAFSSLTRPSILHFKVKYCEFSPPDGKSPCGAMVARLLLDLTIGVRDSADLLNSLSFLGPENGPKKRGSVGESRVSYSRRLYWEVDGAQR